MQGKVSSSCVGAFNSNRAGELDSFESSHLGNGLTRVAFQYRLVLVAIQIVLLVVVSPIKVKDFIHSFDLVVGTFVTTYFDSLVVRQL